MSRLAVICGRGPVPDETFVRRDLAALRELGWGVRVFGLNQCRLTEKTSIGETGAVFLKFLRMARHSPRQAWAMARRQALISSVASYVGSDGVLLAEFAWITADIASVASRICGRPWACFVHAWDVFSRPAAELRARLEGARAVVTCSREAHDALLRAGIPVAIVRLVHHGLPLGRMENLRLPKESRSVCAVGRFEAKKGFDLLLRAWPLVSEQLPGARLRLIGDGGERRKLERLAGCCRGVEILPAMAEEEVWREISKSELLVLPSRKTRTGDRDGIANVLLEAMALRTAVITTDAGAAGEIVRNNETGILLHEAENSPEALARKIKMVLVQDEFRAALIDRAHHAVREEFDLSETSHKLHAVLSDLLLL